MKDKIISFLIGVAVWWMIVYGYWYFTNDAWSTGWPQENRWFDRQQGGGLNGQQNIDAAPISDEQLESIAQRAGISLEELKTRLDNGEEMTDIIPTRWGWAGGARWGWTLDWAGNWGNFWGGNRGGITGSWANTGAWNIPQ